MPDYRDSDPELTNLCRRCGADLEKEWSAGNELHICPPVVRDPEIPSVARGPMEHDLAAAKLRIEDLEREREGLKALLGVRGTIAFPPGRPPDLGSALMRLGRYLGAIGPDAAEAGHMIATELGRRGEELRRLREMSQEMMRAPVIEEREACIAIVREQPFYPDTTHGMRQQWVKDQIAEKIRARGGHG